MSGVVTLGSIGSMLTVMAIAYGVPVFVVEQRVWKAENAGKRLNLRKLRFTSFAVSLVASAAWIFYVFQITGRRDFSHGQVVGASITGVVLIVGLILLADRWHVCRTTAALLVTLYSSLAAGLAFSIMSAGDTTGLWGVGLVFLAILSLLGFGMVAQVTIGILALRSRNSKS